MTNAQGYFDSPWPCEDGGPARMQTPLSGKGLQLQTGERLKCVTRRTCLSTMTLLGAPGEALTAIRTELEKTTGSIDQTVVSLSTGVDQYTEKVKALHLILDEKIGEAISKIGSAVMDLTETMDDFVEALPKKCDSRICFLSLPRRKLTEKKLKKLAI